MQFEGNYINRGAIDVSGLVAALGELSEADWDEDSYRQKKFAVHRDTNTIPLLFDADFRHETPTKCKKFSQFEHQLEPIYATLGGYFDSQGWVVRSMFARLRPGGIIPPHADQGFSLTQSHRLHIPLVTNDGACFRVGGEERHLNVGEVWEINNKRTHSAWNRGTEGRIHLICDWAPPMTPELEARYRQTRGNAPTM